MGWVKFILHFADSRELTKKSQGHVDNFHGKNCRMNDKMEKYSFQSFEQDQQDSETASPGTPVRKRVIKKDQVRAHGHRIIEHHDEDATEGITCNPVMQNGRVIAIDVHCACGSHTRIQLEYDQ